MTARLVDWADEEGSRFGRSLFGSSAAAGRWRPGRAPAAPDRDGISLPDALAEHGVDLDRALESARSSTAPRPTSSSTSSRAPCSSRSTSRSASSSAPSASSAHRSPGAARPPMPARRRWIAARRARRRGKLALEIREIASRAGDGAVSTSGASSASRASSRPWSRPPSSPRPAASRRDKLAAMLADAKEASERFAAEERIEVEFGADLAIEPILFDDTLIGFCEEAIRSRGHLAPAAFGPAPRRGRGARPASRP